MRVDPAIIRGTAADLDLTATAIDSLADTMPAELSAGLFAVNLTNKNTKLFTIADKRFLAATAMLEYMKANPAKYGKGAASWVGGLFD